MTTCPQAEWPARTTVFILLTDLQQDPLCTALPRPPGRLVRPRLSHRELPLRGLGPSPHGLPCCSGLLALETWEVPRAFTPRPQEDAGENVGPMLSGGGRVAGPRTCRGGAAPPGCTGNTAGARARPLFWERKHEKGEERST